MRRRTGTLVFEDLGGLGKVMPFAGFVFGLAAFAAIGLARLREFRRRSDDFLRRVSRRRGPGSGSTSFQIATVLALWGVVISAVYMLRAYRAVFMGRPGRSEWSGLPISRDSCGCPIILLDRRTALWSASFRNHSSDLSRRRSARYFAAK